jgi:hypothetical protein
MTTKRTVIGWTIEIQVPYHHSNISRWKAMLVDINGKLLIEDWLFDTEEQALAALKKWSEQHPTINVQMLRSAQDGD